MFNAFEKGALIFNYLGHGGEDGLAAERIWEKSDGQNLNNQYKYPCLTITCEFHVLIILLGPQQANLLESKGGAIAMLTTREISQFNGEILTIDLMPAYSLIIPINTLQLLKLANC
jgi:hypothetical protein